VNETLAMMGQARAMRRLRSDPVDPPLVDALLWAGTRAASPNNSQLWRFVVVTDEAVRAAIADALLPFTEWVDSLGPPTDPSDARIRRESRHLIVHIGSAPVLIFVCAEHSYPSRGPDVRYLWSVTNTASQNIIVAARSLGLGATLTMMQVGNQDGVRRVLGIPDGIEVGSLIPIGWPDRPFGPVHRKPIAEVVHRDRW
jgi:nitroreductase